MDIIFGETNDQIRIDDQQFFHLTENQEEKLVEGTGTITFLVIVSYSIICQN